MRRIQTDTDSKNRTFAAAKIQWPPSTSNTSAALCALSLHRNANCDGPTIGPNERIGWDTRICFRWSCDGAAGTGMAMRVENCWTGSEHSPIELIDHLGCSRRETMISTPVHRHGQRVAQSAGWLTVRLFNTNHIRLSCAIRLCHACNDECRTKITPNCSTLLRNGKEDEKERWKTELEQICTEERNRIQSATAAGSAVSRSTGRRWLINKMVVMFPSMIINFALSNKLTGRASIGG
uniref:ZP domain-containing protein n=1 Tax=Globodera pallida TaxID=36090 RepID=A0A183CJV6_GLOPA